jgi:hypothetical protein
MQTSPESGGDNEEIKNKYHGVTTTPDSRN